MPRKKETDAPWMENVRRVMSAEQHVRRLAAGQPSPKGGRRTVADVVVEALLAGVTSAAEVAGRVRKEFPHARTGRASVNWYATRLRRVGKRVGTITND
jgi:hypothetical protein